MSDYIRIPIAVDPDDVNAEQIADLKARVSGWNADAKGNLDVAILEVRALQSAQLREVASSVTDDIYRTAGASLDGIQPLDATAATAGSTWTMRDTAGYLIPAGTEVKKTISGDQAIGFRVTADVTVPPGSSVTGTGEVALEALIAGAAGTGLTGSLDLVTPLDGVIAIALDGATVGGRDAEDDTAYLDRLTRTRRRRKDSVVLAADVVPFLRDEIPGLGRALVLDNYDPGPPVDTNAAAALAVIGIDPDGGDLSGGVKTAIIAALEAEREQGFLFSVLDPVRTNLAVTFTATSYPISTAAAVKAAGEQAITDYLHPRNWGQPPYGDQPLWFETLTVRFGELYAVLNAVPGLNEVLALTITPPGTANTDLTMTGPGALPNLTSVVGTVT